MKKTKMIAYTAILTALYFVLSALLRIPVTEHLVLDCLIYGLPFLLKIPTGLVAWFMDSLVMILFGLPLSLSLKKTVSRLVS